MSIIKSAHTIARRAHSLGAQSPKAAPVAAPVAEVMGPIFDEYHAPIWGVVEYSGVYSFSHLRFLKVACGAGNLTCAQAHVELEARRASRPDVRESEAVWDAYMS